MAGLSNGVPTRLARDRLVKVTGLYPASVADPMGFFRSLGLVEGIRGAYGLTRAGLAVAEAWTRDDEQARLLLRPLMLNHWAARKAAGLLAGGALPQEELAAKLKEGLPGNDARGIYMLEWLWIGLVVQRDERLCVRLLPQRAGETDASPPPAPARDDTVFGLPLADFDVLPDEQYERFMKGVVQSLRALGGPGE
ncbi:hypothetical protein ACFVS7_06975 [Streptomyces rubiginosohelvolus]|uniref:hypothetical protein n=1 Tax=Streptomyces rubiginosohelvolus TaxID=67362 RepID=UPI0036DC96DE